MTRGFPAFYLAVLAFLFSAAPAVLAQGVITTVAGTTWIFRGDGGSALSAPLGRQISVAVDGAGNFYAADYENHQVVKVSSAGVLTVVAGNGIAGFSGDGGQSRAASLNGPHGVAVDSNGNVFIADRRNHRIRRVDMNGIIRTVAGNGIGGFGGDGGPATNARISAPKSVAVDGSGNLFILDRGNHRIRRVGSDGVIQTVAGNGTSGFSGDGGPATAASFALDFFGNNLAVDGNGNIYIPDTHNHRIRKVDRNGIVTTVAGSGVAGFAGDGAAATSARLAEPASVDVDAAGNIYIADAANDRIRRVNPQGIISTVAGAGGRGFAGDGGSAMVARLSFPQDVAVDAAGNIYIADFDADRVRRVADGVISTVAGNGLFRFGGDNAPATTATMRLPCDVTVDAAGNIYISDVNGHRIRQVNPAGIITTVAGGRLGFSGDGGPATSAGLVFPCGVAVDRAGILYIADGGGGRVRRVSGGVISTVASNLGGARALTLDAAGNLYVTDDAFHRVRKITPAGVVSIIAGTGAAGFSGDGGLATSAQLDHPWDVAVDPSGNVYIADSRNCRIRRIDAVTGRISTIAGNGARTSAGDGGQALNASLALPYGVIAGPGGVLYISEAEGHRVRRIGADGVITTVAGNGVAAFAGDGGPATAASINGPEGIALDAAGNLYIVDVFSGRVRRVLAAAPSFSVAPTTLRFSAAAGGTADSQQIAISSTVTGLAWTAQAATESGGAWLSLSQNGGTLPVAISVSTSATALAPGTYRGTVRIDAPQAVPSTQTIAVELTVQAAQSPRLEVGPSALTFEIAGGSVSAPAQTLRVNNAGGGSLAWAAQAATANGGNWLGVSPSAGSVAPGSPASIQVSVNPAGLAAGLYSGTIVVSSAATSQTQTVSVTLLLSSTTQVTLLTQTGLLFTGVAGGGNVPSQSFGIANVGDGAMNWTAQTRTLSGGSWLRVSPASGRNDAASLEIPQVEVNISAAGLAAGRYSGVVQVDAPGAINSPQFVTVELNVLPAGSNPGVIVRPTGLIFATQAGTSSPGSQSIRVATAAGGNISFASGLLTLTGGNWLEALPLNGVVSSTSPQTITVQPTLGSLGPGAYRGALTLLFSDGSVQTVNLFFLVGGGGVSAARDSEAGRACAAERLYAVFRSLENNFSSPVGWPNPIEMQVVDDCGSAVPNASVVASFSNGDAPITLSSLRNGTYVGTWRPANAAAQVTVTGRASAPGLQPAQVQAVGLAPSNPGTPVLGTGGIVNAATFGGGGAAAPGAIVSVFGRSLARSVSVATRVPLETTLGGATLSVGGRDLPLFFSSDGQINAQLPFELTPNSRQQVVARVRRENSTAESLAVPEAITIAATQPGIFTTNSQGTGQGAILDVAGRVVDAAAPARAGEVVAVFCTGLGMTNPRVTSGSAAPSAEPFARVTLPVTARVGDRPATVHFAGLAPGFVGLYQVNVEIPAGVEPGAAAPLVLLQNGVTSNTVTLAVR